MAKKNLPNLDKLIKKKERMIQTEGLGQAAIMVQNTAVKMINKGPASGRPRPKKGRTKASRSSAPGEAPMADTGTLARGVVTDNKDGEWFVVSTAEYSKALEFGTRNMEPRPFLRPALQKNRKLIVRLLANQIRKR